MLTSFSLLNFFVVKKFKIKIFNYLFNFIFNFIIIKLLQKLLLAHHILFSKQLYHYFKNLLY